MGDEVKDLEQSFAHSRRTLPEIEEAIKNPRTDQQSELNDLMDKASAPAIREFWPIKVRRWARRFLR